MHSSQGLVALGEPAGTSKLVSSSTGTSAGVAVTAHGTYESAARSVPVAQCHLPVLVQMQACLHMISAYVHALLLR